MMYVPRIPAKRMYLFTSYVYMHQILSYSEHIARSEDQSQKLEGLILNVRRNILILTKLNCKQL